MKFWRSTRKIKAVKYVEYTRFMQKNSSHYSEESDSDFEPPAPKKVKETIDLTIDEDTASALKNRLDLLEHGLNKTLESYEEKERLRRIITCMEKEKEEILNEKRSLQVAIENVKDRMSCIICRSVASFPWLVTPCCKIISCKECADRWLFVEESCPHCRATVQCGSCAEVREIRPIQELTRSWLPTQSE